MTFEADKNGFLTWDRNAIGGRTKVFCPFNKKMQCNYNCPLFIIEKETTVKMYCKAPTIMEFKNTCVKVKE